MLKFRAFCFDGFPYKSHFGFTFTAASAESAHSTAEWLCSIRGWQLLTLKQVQEVPKKKE